MSSASTYPTAMPRMAPPQHVLLVPEPLTPSSFSAFGTAILSPLPQYLTSIPQTAPAPLYQPHQPQPVHANQNTAIKTSPISPLVNKYPEPMTAEVSARSTSSMAFTDVPSEAKGLMSIFSCFPRRNTYFDAQTGQMRLQVEILERHPYTTQTFCPFNFSSSSTSTTSGTRVSVRALATSPNPSTASPSLSPSPTYILIIVAPSVIDYTSHPSNPPDLSRARAFVSPIVPDGSPGVAVTYAPGTWHAPMVVLGDRRVDFLVTQFVNGRPEDDCQEVRVGEEEETKEAVLSQLSSSSSSSSDDSKIIPVNRQHKSKHERNPRRRVVEVDLKGMGLLSKDGSEGRHHQSGLWKPKL